MSDFESGAFNRALPPLRFLTYFLSSILANDGVLLLSNRGYSFMNPFNVLAVCNPRDRSRPFRVYRQTWGGCNSWLPQSSPFRSAAHSRKNVLPAIALQFPLMQHVCDDSCVSTWYAKCNTTMQRRLCIASTMTNMNGFQEPASKPYEVGVEHRIVKARAASARAKLRQLARKRHVVGAIEALDQLCDYPSDMSGSSILIQLCAAHVFPIQEQRMSSDSIDKKCALPSGIEAEANAIRIGK